MVLRQALHGRAEEAQAPAQPLGPHVAALGMRFWHGEPRHTALFWVAQMPQLAHAQFTTSLHTHTHTLLSVRGVCPPSILL